MFSILFIIFLLCLQVTVTTFEKGELKVHKVPLKNATLAKLESEYNKYVQVKEQESEERKHHEGRKTKERVQEPNRMEKVRQYFVNLRNENLLKRLSRCKTSYDLSRFHETQERIKKISAEIKLKYAESGNCQLKHWTVIVFDHSDFHSKIPERDENNNIT